MVHVAHEKIEYISYKENMKPWIDDSIKAEMIKKLLNLRFIYLKNINNIKGKRQF